MGGKSSKQFLYDVLYQLEKEKPSTSTKASSSDPEKKEQSLTQLFDSLDKDHDHKLSREELAEFINSLFVIFWARVCPQRLCPMKDGSSYRMVSVTPDPTPFIKRKAADLMFNYLDWDGDSNVSKNEFNSGLQQLLKAILIEPSAFLDDEDVQAANLSTSVMSSEELESKDKSAIPTILCKLFHNTIPKLTTRESWVFMDYVKYDLASTRKVQLLYDFPEPNSGWVRSNYLVHAKAGDVLILQNDFGFFWRVKEDSPLPLKHGYIQKDYVNLLD